MNRPTTRQQTSEPTLQNGDKADIRQAFTIREAEEVRRLCVFAGGTARHAVAFSMKAPAAASCVRGRQCCDHRHGRAAA
jgi:hypothetical protein